MVPRRARQGQVRRQLHSTLAISSISTQAPIGNCATPKALRACAQDLPERRGAPVLGFTKIDTKKITDRSEIAVCDYIVVLDETLIDQNTIKTQKRRCNARQHQRW